MTSDPTLISVAPIPYFWPRDEVFAFYDMVASSPADIVYLGEVVCAKRRELKLADWIAIGKALQAAGKEVLLSTLSLVHAKSELLTLQKICAQEDFMVEANDMGAVQYCRGQAFCGGASLNIYNPRSLSGLIDLGLTRWVAPIELSREAIRLMNEQLARRIQVEVTAFGRLPLAHSARCFTARAHHRQKDDCGLQCLDYPDGQLLKTREDDKFLTLNGVQTLSAGHCNLLMEYKGMLATGVDILRLTPQARGMEQIIAAFDGCRRGTGDPEQLLQSIAPFIPHGINNGYWHGLAGMHP
jgi:collagenase-like PrtC family protease